MSAAASFHATRVVAFLSAEAFSAIGTWATIIAIWGYAAFEFDATATEVGRFGLAFTLPAVLLGPVTGTLIDRYGPRAVLGASKVIGVAASLALLGADDFASLTLLSALHGVGGALGVPALQSMPPRLVADEHLARTNALVSLTDELAIVLGPAFGGAAIAAFGFHGAFVFDAVTYAIGLVALPFVHLRAVTRDADAVAEADSPPAARGLARQVRDAFEGITLVARTAMLRRTVLCVAAVHLLYGSALLSEPLYVRDVLHRPPSVFAALQTVFGIALVIAALGVARLGERLAGFGWVAAGVAGSGVAAIVYLGTPWIAVAFLGVALWGVLTATISGPSRTVLQRNSAESHHGRVLATDTMVCSAAQLTGVVLCSVLVEAVGVQSTITGIGLAVTTVALLFAAAARRDRLPTLHPTVGPPSEPALG